MSDINARVSPNPQTVNAGASVQPGEPKATNPAGRGMRLWIPVLFVCMHWVGVFVPRYFAPATQIQMYSMMVGSLFGTLGVVAWWLLASRVRWRDRWLGLAVFVGAGAAFYPLMDSSINMMGVFITILPMVTTVWVLTLVLTAFLSWRTRRGIMLAAIVLTWSIFTMDRFEGVDGVFAPKLVFRWMPTAEDKFLASPAANKLVTPKPLDATATHTLVLEPGDWPGFRGANRDGRLTGVKIATDWKQQPPKELWRHRVGPGWSSFAVVGNYLFTQAQLRDDELVVCYAADTGDAIWVHKDKTRFSETLGGDGPRATPTFHNGKLYTLGATGILNCFDARTGQKQWSCNIADDSGAKVPIWGFASSPLVVQDVVTVFAGGPGGKSVLGYEAATGKPVWQAGDGETSYSSLQPAKLCGAEQVLICTDKGLAALDPARGNLVWNHDWVLDGIPRVSQPAILSDSEVLFGSPMSNGTKRIQVGQQGSTWGVKETWISNAISPYFNDFVVHNGHLYGFDGNFLTCVSLENGKRKWRERGYGNGQVLLLADQNVLLVLAETGEAALIEAADKFKELGHFKAIEGKTWNHPVVANGKLYVRNSEEMACFELKALP